MKKLLLADSALTPFWIKVIRLVEPVVLLALTFLVTGSVGLLVPLLTTVTFIYAESLSDYMVYAGFSSRRQKWMNYIRCSGRGTEIVRNALTGDAIRLLFRGLLGAGVPSLICSLYFEVPSVAEAVVNAAGQWMLACAIVMFIRLVTRPLAMTVQTYMTITNILIWVVCLGYVLVYMSRFAGKEANIGTASLIRYDVIVLSAALVLDVVFGILLVKTGVSGVKCGYSDN